MKTRWLNTGEQAAWRAWLDMYRLLLPALDEASRLLYHSQLEVASDQHRRRRADARRVGVEGWPASRRHCQTMTKSAATFNNRGASSFDALGPLGHRFPFKA